MGPAAAALPQLTLSQSLLLSGPLCPSVSLSLAQSLVSSVSVPSSLGSSGLQSVTEYSRVPSDVQESVDRVSIDRRNRRLTTRLWGMGSISSNSSSVRGMVPNSNPTKEPVVRDRRYTTCCDCCHIKTGTAFLGLLEATVLAALLYGIVQQLVWKSATYSRGGCNSHILRDCLLLDFSHFSLTLIFDYIIALLLVVVLFSILLMFCGIFSDTSCLLFPHLFVQAIFLLFSVGYFILYAWSYFYGDLYTHKRSFEVQSFIERMWLASLLLILASFQVYLFFAVFKCSLYLAKVDNSRRERETAFERLSERVRIAKENGLWRQSGVGGFLSYTRQEEDEKRKRERKERLKGMNVGHVQWSNENKVVLLDEDPSRSETAPPLYRQTVQFQQQKSPIYEFPPVIEDLPAEPRRRSTDTIESRDNSPTKGGRTPSMVSQTSNNPRFGQFHSQKDRDKHTVQVKRSESAQKSSRAKGDFPVRIPLDAEYGVPATPPSPVRRKSSREEKLKEASLAAIANEKARREREREREQREAEKARTSSSSSPEKESRETRTATFKAPKRVGEKLRAEKVFLNIEAPSTSAQYSPTSQPHHHHHHHTHSNPSTSYDQSEERRDSETAEERRKSSRALRKLRSVDSGEFDVPEEVFERRMKSRRRSSDAGRAAGAVRQEERVHKHHKKEKESGNASSPTERKTQDSSVIVKKISISATVSPFA